MQDLFQKYVGDLYVLRDAFHDELTAQAQELSKAMGIYAQRSDEALALFMENVSARSAEVRTAAAARLDQFYGLSAKQSLPNVSDGPLAPANGDEEKVAAAAERAFADGPDVKVDWDRKTGHPMVLVKSNPAA
jgi:hypothetical protein